MAELVESREAAMRLAEVVLDPGRTGPVVCVTVPTWASRPLVDVDALEEALGDAAQVWVMPTGDASWELTYRLPTGLDVYGGAVRVWRPGVDEKADRDAHPLFLVHDRSDSPMVVERLLSAFDLPNGRGRDAAAVGSEHAAVVTRVLPAGAELELAGGVPALALASQLTRHDLAPPRVVRPGQPVRVRVVQTGGRRRVVVSLLPFEPEPWARVVAHRLGTVVEAVVTGLRNFGVLVELLPGCVGLVPRRLIGRQWVPHPEELFAAGDRVSVRIEHVDDARRRITLSMLDIPADVPAAVMSIYPDGPPWLPPMTGPAATEDATPPDHQDVAPAEGDDVDPSDGEAGENGEPADTGQTVAAAGSGSAAPPPQPAAGPPPVAAASTPAPFPEVPPGEVDDLERMVGQAHEAQRQLRALVDAGTRRLARLRGEATRIRHELERDLTEVRLRVLELVENDTNQLIGTTAEALATARAEAAALREQLTAVEQDRHRLVEQLREASGRAERAEHASAEARQGLSEARRGSDRLQAELARLVPDEHARLREEIHTAWQRATTATDRDSHRWREPAFGPDFVASLDRVQGVSRERVVAVCAEVVCGRAAQRPGLEVHPLRTASGGGAPQRVRADGAKAYRASLQAGAPAARRLHYWRLPDGGIELAKVVYHDDFSIR